MHTQSCTHTHPLSACVLLTHNSSHSDMHVETCFQFFHFLVSTSSFSPLPPLTMSYINIVACMPKGYYTHPNLSIYRRQFKYTKNAKKISRRLFGHGTAFYDIWFLIRSKWFLINQNYVFPIFICSRFKTNWNNVKNWSNKRIFFELLIETKLL